MFRLWPLNLTERTKLLALIALATPRFRLLLMYMSRTRLRTAWT